MEHPDRQWRDRSDKDPNPDIELFTNNDQGFFYVFLNDPDRVPRLLNRRHQADQVSVNLNTSASRFATRFQNPRILPNIKLKLLPSNNRSVRVQQRLNHRIKLFFRLVLIEHYSLLEPL